MPLQKQIEEILCLEDQARREAICRAEELSASVPILQLCHRLNNS